MDLQLDFGTRIKNQKRAKVEWFYKQKLKRKFM